MNYDKMTVKQLRALASELGVLPKGRATKKVLIAALEPSGPSDDGPSEQWQTPSQEVYLYDRAYIVVKPFSGYEKGDVVSNLARGLGLVLVENGSIKLDADAPRMSNPNTIARVTPQGV